MVLQLDCNCQLVFFKRTDRAEHQLRSCAVNVKTHLGHDRNRGSVVRLEVATIGLQWHLLAFHVTEHRCRWQCDLVHGFFVQLTIDRHSDTLLETACAGVALTGAFDVLRTVLAKFGLALILGHSGVGALCIARPASGLGLCTLDVGALKEHTRHRCGVDQDDFHGTLFAHTHFFATNKLTERTALDADTLVAATATSKGARQTVFDTAQQGEGGVVRFAKQGHFVAHLRFSG